VDMQTLYIARQKRLAGAIERAGFAAMALNPGPSLLYLTGLNFHLMERPVVALFPAHEAPCIVLPELEAAKVQSISFPIRAITYGEDPERWPEAFAQAFRTLEIDHGEIGVEPLRLRYLELRLLEEALPQGSFVNGGDLAASLRRIKDPSEVAAMRRAVDITQRALNATLPSIRPGTSERELASELTLQLYRHGADTELPFPPIVSAGPNSANPHASPTNRLIVPGDLLVIDWGASFEHYVADLTRTFAIGEVEPRLREIARVVKEANLAAQAAVRPGVTPSQVDQAARSVIEAAGYGEYFIHRTGHGLGMDPHEEPYIRAGNDEPLEPGMAFTIEPGIYLPGDNGVRIEDNVIVTQDGCEVLSDLPRDLISIGI